MDNILVVSGGEKGRVYFTDFLTACKYGSVATADDGASAAEALEENAFDLCIINAPLPDGSGVELALRAVAQGCCQCLVVAPAEQAPKFRAALEPSGVFVISKPVKKVALWSTLKSIAVVRNRIRAMQAQNETLKQKLEDVRLVNRAKALLISNLKMSEQQSHRFIEKQAMERRVTKAEIARRIINTYDINRFEE
jgi:response regulator NasT